MSEKKKGAKAAIAQPRLACSLQLNPSSSSPSITMHALQQLIAARQAPPRV